MNTKPYTLVSDSVCLLKVMGYKFP